MKQLLSHIIKPWVFMGLLTALIILPTMAQETNLLSDANFETPPNSKELPKGWIAYQWGAKGSQFAVSREANAGRDNSTALRAQNIDAKARAGAYTYVNLQPGTYELTAWARAAKGQRSTVRLYLSTAYSPSFEIGEEWQQISFTSTLGAAKERAGIYVQNYSGKADTVWFDDVALRRVADGPDSWRLYPENFAAVTGKKLIEYGWDVPEPWFIRDHITEMEKRPFEGVVYRLPHNLGKVFDVQNWEKNSDKSQEQLNILASIKWGKLTDNFLATYAASTMDWYNDSDWEKVLSNIAFCARAAKIASNKGIMFDPEPYGDNPWTYAKQKHAKQYSFAQYSDKVYERGQQFMRTMQKEMPGLKLLTLYQYKMFYNISHDPNAAARTKPISEYSYGLWLSFLNGMLAEAGPNVQFIDGNEHSYYYTQPSQFYQSYWEMRQGSRINVPDALKEKFDGQVRAGQALYVDHLFDMRGLPLISHAMTPEEQDKWFEQNVYYALQTSDEYVWLYSQNMDWWDSVDVMKRTNMKKRIAEYPGILPRVQQAIISAKAKLQSGQKLGYDMESTFTKAQSRFDQMLAEKLQKRSATLPRLKPGQAPKIDGKLEEPLYQELPWSEDFVGYLKTTDATKLVAPTRVFTAYDEKNLYIALRCDEPNMAAQQVAGTGRDSNVWAGESVEISILKPGQRTNDENAVFYHFMVNPANMQWDAMNTGTQADLAVNFDWQSAVQKTDSGWTAEIIIPWKEIGIAEAEAGAELRANIARLRFSDKREYSSWSQFVSGFQEPQHFGIWKLGASP